MLNAHVADTEPISGMAQDGEATFTTRPGPGDEFDGGSGDEPGRARQDNRVGVEEIMERLADELETEFVRTYGSSGG